jgi:hypothetical protein
MMTQTDQIQEHMDVICSCGTRLGKVDRVDGDMIKLAKNDPASGGVHHWVPLSWVDHVDDHVHLNKNSVEAKEEWEVDVE